MATIRDIAKKSGVSVGTVSRVLNGSCNVSRELAAKVRACVDQMGYQPNSVARYLAQGRHGGRSIKAIAAVFCRMSSGWQGNPMFGQWISGITRVCNQKNYHLIVEMRHEDPNEFRPRCLESGQIAGLLVKTSQDDFSFLDKWELPCPLVVFGGRAPDWPVDQVGFDNRGASATALRYLWENGHRRISFLSVSAEHSQFRERASGYREYLETKDCFDPALLIELALKGSEWGAQPRFQPADLAAELDRAMAMDSPPTAVLACNDATASALFHVCQKKGIKIGRDLSIVGFDDVSPVVQLLNPGLTTVAMPFQEMSEVATSTLSDRLEEPPEARRPYALRLLSGRLQVRESVARLNEPHKT